MASFFDSVSSLFSGAAQAVSAAVQEDVAARARCVNIGKNLGQIAGTGVVVTLALSLFQVISFPSTCALIVLGAETLRLGEGYIEAAGSARTSLAIFFAKTLTDQYGVVFSQGFMQFYQASEKTYLYRCLSQSILFYFLSILELRVRFYVWQLSQRAPERPQ
jgi:hypothetical protein